MNTVIVENCKTLFIGRRGENEVTEVVFDFSAWQEQFGAGVIDLYVKRNLDVDAYPVVLSVDGTVATWLVTAADTDVVGNGKIEFVYTVNEKVAKSAVFPFFVGEDIGESSPEPPEHYQSWLEQLTELGAETQANAQAAAQSASEAAESAAQVAEDSNNAEAWAVGERNGEPVSEDDPTYNNNAKYWAENARANAPVQSVNGEDGDVVLTLDNIPNGETYARATPEQIAQIATNAENIASVEAIASTALQPDDLTPYRTAAQQSSIDNDLNSKINRNTGSIADINARIPFSASASNKLVDQNSFDSKLSDYRTASQQNLIDNNKQTKITANGILKGNGLGGISAAVAGMDYLPTSALAAYRSANAQDAIDNAQNQNINKNTAALTTMQPAATAADIGKALIVKTVADGKPTSYEYGEAGGGGSVLTAGDGIDIANDVISNTQGIEYIVGTQTAATSKWTGVSTDETLKVGKIIAYYLPYAGTSTAATLALTMADGTTTREISLQLKPNATVTTQFPAGSIIILVYDGTYWRVNASYDTDTNTYPTGYCVTNGSVAAKAAACSFGYRGDANYFPCLFRFANTATDATLAITTYAPEAAPIYVNGARTSATNTFSAGVILFLYYNGAYYCYNDGRFPILVDGAVTSVQEYAAGLLADYRTAADQDTIDAGKQAKITANGILKGDGTGGVSAAVAGTDYATPQQVSEKYTKPTDGIPSTDMTAAVQASLSKAESALQAVPDTYRTAADQDLIDNGKQAKITASGILKGDGAGGVSAAVAGVDYLKSAPVTSVNGQTGDVTIQTATDAQVTTAVNTWLGENVAQETGYVLDASLTMSNAAPPASAVGELKSAFNADLVSTDWAPNITKGSYIRVSDGKAYTSAKYARTSALWDGFGARKAIAVNDPTYEFCLALYDETGNLSGTGYLESLGYSTGMQYIPKTAAKIGISFRRVDQAALTDEDITAISAALSAFAATDTTLSVAGAPADAKATGDMLSTSILEKDILPANTDLNTFTDIGLYRIPSGNSVLPTLVNYPSTNPGRLLVLSDENGYYCTQVVITSGNVIFTRVQTSTTNHTWTDWASYDGSVVRTRSAIKNENDRYDADLTLTNGIYSFSATAVGNSDNLPSSFPGILLVFGGSAVIFQTYINRYGTVFYRIRYVQNAFSEWYRPLRPDATLSIEGAAADAKTVGDAVRSGYVHDGDILRMSTTPEAIPVNENHMGYNEFISSTWDTLLPTGYQEGDAYNASTTKIHGVKVERASSWTSTPYGTNVDTYTIYRYIFTPQNGYDKTLFLTSGCHGNEAEAYWGLYRLVRMIYFEGHKYPTLRNLRDCRLIIIPSWNPWGFQHYRRYNAFSALNTGSTDVARSYQAWAWLMASNHQVTVNGTVYDISQVGEANVIWETLNEYQDSINLWLDFHTDPYAGRDTSNVDIDDPRGVTPPYGCYGFSAKDSRGYRQLFSVMYDFYNILEDEYQFTETWHPQATNPGGSSFTGWMAQFGFPGGVVEVSTFMDGFPYASGSAGMMKLAQEYYGNCIAEMLR